MSFGLSKSGGEETAWTGTWACQLEYMRQHNRIENFELSGRLMALNTPPQEVVRK